MSIARTINTARAHLVAGNSGAYARVMSGAIRAAMSERAANAFRGAIAEDGAQAAFLNLSTSCPTAK